MVELKTKKKLTFSSNQRLFVHYISILIVSLFVSTVVSPTLWTKNVYLVHTIFELICVFISIATFLIVWNTYEKSLNINHFIGFGFMTVAIFDIFHTYYFFSVRVLGQGYLDLSTRYWIIGRLVEAVVLLIASLKIEMTKLNKWRTLSFTILLSVGTCLILIYFPRLVPVMMNNDGLTPIKIRLEYTVIAITIISIFNLRNKIDEESSICYKHIIMVLLLIIPAELCFTLFKVVTSFYSTYGHVLKIAYYYYLYKAVFVNVVIYPYNKIENEHVKLEEKNREVTHLSETLDELISTLPIAVLMYDNNGVVKYVNKKFEELFECEERNIKGLPVKEVNKIFVEDSHNKKTIYERTLIEGKSLSGIIETYRIPKGKHLKLFVSSHLIKDGVLMLFKDVKKEQELENLQLQTQTVLNAMDKLVVLVDENNKIIMCNKAYEEVFGILEEDVIGIDVHSQSIMPIARLEKEYEKTDSSDVKVRNIEVCCTVANGEKKRLLCNVTPIYNIDGDLIGKIGVACDISHLREQQEKMIQQEKLALLGQMGASIVHETRNYLTTIKGSCQLIDIQTDKKNIKNYTAKINKGIDEVNRIISEFLSLSKPRELQLEEVSIYDIVQSIKYIVETSSLLRGIDISFYLSKDEEYLLCDESQIKQVVLNICKNAVDAMTDVKNAKLIIEAGYDNQTNEMFIKISDNGQGMSEETLKKLGSPFFTTKKTGTGLGLNVCYTIIKEHKGRIEVDSELGKGTTFRIILPCIEDDDEFEDVIS